MVLIPCADCGQAMRYRGAGTTLLAYDKFDGHVHDRNCVAAAFVCDRCTKEIWLPVKLRCPKPGCAWEGKDDCFCHAGQKTDSDELRTLVESRFYR